MISVRRPIAGTLVILYKEFATAIAYAGVTNISVGNYGVAYEWFLLVCKKGSVFCFFGCNTPDNADTRKIRRVNSATFAPLDLLSTEGPAFTTSKFLIEKENTNFMMNGFTNVYMFDGTILDASTVLLQVNIVKTYEVMTSIATEDYFIAANQNDFDKRSWIDFSLTTTLDVTSLALGGALKSILWVKDTQLCIVSGLGTKVAFFNFFDFIIPPTITLYEGYSLL